MADRTASNPEKTDAEGMHVATAENAGNRRMAPQLVDEEHTDLASLVQDYANMQAEAKRMPEILSALAPLDIMPLPKRLLRFLDPNAIDASSVARSLLGSTGCASYHDSLTLRMGLLERLITSSATLPLTANPGDLSLPVANRQCGKASITTDSGNAVRGPAGLSLHSLCAGCAVLVAVLAEKDDLKLAAKHRYLKPVLSCYLDTLVVQGYTSRAALQECLPGAICAGAIGAVLNYADCAEPAISDRATHKRLKRDLRARLSDLLDLCDLLALSSRDSVLQCARDYNNNGRRWRAERLLRGFLARGNDDPELLARLAWVCLRRGKHRAAADACQDGLRLDPANPQLHQQLGDALLQRLQFNQASRSFKEALRCGAARRDVAPRLTWATTLQRCEQQASLAPEVPTLTLTGLEVSSKKWRHEHLALGARLFQEYGVLLIHNAFSKRLLEACRAEFIRRYAAYFTEQTHLHALRIGDKRFQISVALEGTFNDPGLYANPFILEIMLRLLGAEYLLGCTVCATSLPGAKGQHLHKDHRALFAGSADEAPLQLPPFAVTTMVPLVSLDEKIGTTAVRKRSHLLSQPDSLLLPSQLPMVPLGSCFLMDMRLSHAGMANQTDLVRPIMNMVYQRYWFADSRNFEKHPPLRVSAAAYRQIPKQHRRLFDWGAQPGPQVSRQ